MTTAFFAIQEDTFGIFLILAFIVLLATLPYILHNLRQSFRSWLHNRRVRIYYENHPISLDRNNREPPRTNPNPHLPC